MSGVLKGTIRKPSAPVEQPANAPSRFAAAIDIDVDARDIQRGIFHVRETLRFTYPSRATLLYPKWLPGYHAPEAPLELLTGLRFSCSGEVLEWRRDPISVHAFHVEIPPGAKALAIEFQLLCATASDQGRVSVTRQHINLQWNSVLLYPAGYLSKQIEVSPSIQLPDGWHFACALEARETAYTKTRFAPAALDVVVDSPLFAGANYKRYELDPLVGLNVFGDEPADVKVGGGPLSVFKNLIAEADHLFGARHFGKYNFLIAVSDELGPLGVEHHQSTELVLPRTFFTDWEGTRSKNDIVAHEYVHSWNGKFRRGRDSCTASFDEPIQSSLLWVYEGLTQYWGQVLAARSGLWSVETFRGALARTAARCANMAGRRWRPLRDTTCDPVIHGREKIPWESWQRNQDYYTDGQLIWLEVDTMIRELSQEQRSLDDFARAFFGTDPGRVATLSYDFDELIAALGCVVAFDWAAFFSQKLSYCDPSPPLAGLTKGGYALAYEEKPTDFHCAQDALSGLVDLTFSIGLSASTEGKIKEVIWDSPAFHAGVTAGSEILMINGREFSASELEAAVAECADKALIRMMVKKLKHVEDLEVLYSGKPRYPHLARCEDQPPRLDHILQPRR